MPDPGIRGALVLVVGPSGAGKDTLIAHAARVFAETGLVVARRIVTRLPGGWEDHDTLDPAAFAAARADGRFAVSWHAHGLDYALPRTIDDRLAEGAVVLCNVSRDVVSTLQSRYDDVHVIYVDAPLAVRQARVAERKRTGETAARVQRAGRFGPDQADHVVHNGGTLADGCAAFEAAVAAVLAGVRSRRAATTER